ncbi:5569_t:CDS:2 [Gigaspora margarita]|uniref:5569_t:CDS:1 n=1 Tax=Gigaspora margarita TaxID=4874 RepID=A0ABN7UR41_GIGMA|nr:5569_t:CDS:2 [Gigaspora margarita]
MEELPTQKTDPKDKSLEQGLQKSVVTTHLNDEEQKAAFYLLYQEKDLFARDMNNLGQTSIPPYRAALSVREFI